MSPPVYLIYPGRAVFSRRIQLCLFVVLLAARSISLLGQDKQAKPTFLITPRLNSAGYFPFTGTYVNKNVNADINLFYEYKGNGFFLFKSQDLVDSHSIINYLQSGIFHTFNISPVFKLRAFFGYLFSQTNGFKDEGSDIIRPSPDTGT